MSRSLKLSVLTAAALAVSLPALASERELDEHVHGKASLSLAIEGGTGLLEIEMPADSAVGFERAPNNDEERALVESTAATLGAADAWMIFTPAQACTVSGGEVEFEVEGSHAEFHGEVELTCSTTPTAVSVAPMFAAFERLEHVEMEAVIDGTSAAKELEADAPMLSF